MAEVIVELVGDEVWNDDPQVVWTNGLTAVKAIMLGGAKALEEQVA